VAHLAVGGGLSGDCAVAEDEGGADGVTFLVMGRLTGSTFTVFLSLKGRGKECASKLRILNVDSV
jgi:hypothetical protein